jgi:hypothetical protein
MNGKLALGNYTADKLQVITFNVPERIAWIEFLELDELVEFVTELFEMTSSVKAGENTIQDLIQLLEEWRETALLNQESGILQDVQEAEQEISTGGGKDWDVVAKDLGVS